MYSARYMWTQIIWLSQKPSHFLFKIFMIIPVNRNPLTTRIMYIARINFESFPLPTKYHYVLIFNQILETVSCTLSNRYTHDWAQGVLRAAVQEWSWFSIHDIKFKLWMSIELFSSAWQFLQFFYQRIFAKTNCRPGFWVENVPFWHQNLLLAILCWWKESDEEMDTSSSHLSNGFLFSDTCFILWLFHNDFGFKLQIELDHKLQVALCGL